MSILDQVDGIMKEDLFFTLCFDLSGNICISTVMKKESMLIDFINRSSMPDEMKSRAGSIVIERMKALSFVD